jgi:hypothetical protein
MRELAERAQVSKNSVLKIEQGHPLKDAVLDKICHGLSTDLTRLEVLDTNWDANYVVHEKEMVRWITQHDRNKGKPSRANPEMIQREEERKRLGTLGFVKDFFTLLRCALPTGSLVGGIVEVYAKTDANEARGEIFVYCLRGTVRMNLNERSGKPDTFVLREGEAATFFNDGDHTYEPVDRIGPTTPAPRFLYVRVHPDRVSMNPAATIHASDFLADGHALCCEEVEETASTA